MIYLYCNIIRKEECIMKDATKLFPIGTVVLLNGAEKKVMITGFYSISPEDFPPQSYSSESEWFFLVPFQPTTNSLFPSVSKRPA